MEKVEIKNGVLLSKFNWGGEEVPPSIGTLFQLDNKEIGHSCAKMQLGIPTINVNSANGNNVIRKPLDNDNNYCKFFHEDNPVQNCFGIVSERVRALSVTNSNRPYNSSPSNIGFSASKQRSSYNEKLRVHSSCIREEQGCVGKDVGSGFVYVKGGTPSLYRSNSSLELDRDPENSGPLSSSLLHREYGSQGSINVPSSSPHDSLSGDTGSLVTDASPKVRSKFQRLWDKDKTTIGLFKKLRSNKNSEGKSEGKFDTNSETSSSTCSRQVKSDNMSDIEQNDDALYTKHPRRSTFAHYDCQSLAAQLTPSALRSLLIDRVNTTTGASAAAMANSVNSSHQESTENLAPDDSDPGDGQSCSLLSSCPFFRNELGGEGERIVSLSRECSWKSNGSLGLVEGKQQLHRSLWASTVGLLESQPGIGSWRLTLCPYVKSSYYIESVDHCAEFYKTYFYSIDHQNWFGVDNELGPVAVSIKKEKVDEACENSLCLPTYLFRVIIRTSETEDALLRLDDMGVHRKFKVGVLYCRVGQTTEEEMYNNECAGPAFSEFLEILGQRVRLKDFDKYRGGLDRKSDSTGLYSVYSQYQGCEIMFHVSTLLPFTSNNRKQLLRKRHIGNDIVTIIFQEPGTPPFSPKFIRSHFQHVFIIVQAINPCTQNTQYCVAVSRFKDVPMFGPPIPEGSTFPKSKKFTEFLLAKTLMGFSRNTKKEKVKVKFIPDLSIRGALSWPICIYDASLQQNVDCIIGISIDQIVLVEEASSSVIFAAPCRSVIGWTLKLQQGLQLYYHQGECLLINNQSGVQEAEGEEILGEIVSRLRVVTNGTETLALTLTRNSAGLLGFNVQQDGVITEVETYGLAAQAGLRPGARLVEICTVALATLTQEQMVDLLKTSMTVTVTVVPPHSDDSPRRALKTFMEKYDRSLSPPRSSNSSGYGTGSSSRSFSLDPSVSIPNAQDVYRLAPTDFDKEPVKQVCQNSTEYAGTLSSTSSSQSSDHWCDPSDETVVQCPSLSYCQNANNETPPPLPARSFQKTSGKQRNFSIYSFTSCSEGSHSDHSTFPQVSEVPPADVNLSNYAVPPPMSRPTIQREEGLHMSEYIAWRNEKLHGNRSSSIPDNSIRQSSVNSCNNQVVSCDRLPVSHSEDELSTGSCSPIARRSWKGCGANNSSSASSCSQSPRMVDSSVKLRQTATPRKTIQRNSASLGNSTLQEELYRLINPDYICDSEEIVPKNQEEKNSTKCNVPILSESKSDSAIGLEPPHNPVMRSGTSEGVLLTARPATVISNPSSTSSPAFTSEIQHSDFNHNSNVALSTEIASECQSYCSPYQSWIPGGVQQRIQEFTNLSSLNNKSNATFMKLKDKPLLSRHLPWKFNGCDKVKSEPGVMQSSEKPESADVDQEWTTLVHTATEAIQKSGEILAAASNRTPESPQEDLLSSPLQDLQLLNDFDISTNNPTELKEHAQQLEQLLHAEQQKSDKLREIVNQLRTENKRLQEESRAAARQLHQFTEWFFNTIDVNKENAQ